MAVKQILTEPNKVLRQISKPVDKVTKQDQILMDASNSIKIDELKEKMYAYSSDEFEGRGTPSKGQQLAVEYLVDHYKNLGIPSVKNDSYLQAVPLQLEDKPNISLNISNQKFIYYQDYISYANGPDRNYESVEIIFAGSIVFLFDLDIDSEAPTVIFSDLLFLRYLTPSIVSISSGLTHWLFESL